jgi:hypothetical protein
MLSNLSDGDVKTNPVLISKVVILGWHSVRSKKKTEEKKERKKRSFIDQKKDKK